MNSELQIKRVRVSGFTLIEVLISLVIAVIGITALLQLQGVFLQSASDAEKRAAAAALAEKKFEELRSFENTSGYNLIGSASAGTSSTESIVVGSSSIDYAIDWSDVTPWTSSGSASISNSEYKEITINVSWDNNESSLAMSSIIAKIDPNLSGLIEKSGFGGDLPDVEYTPGAAPEVIAVDLGNGLKRETSKPLPEVTQKGTSNIVKFEIVTYDTENYRQVTEDFLSVNCICQLSSTPGSGYEASKTVFNQDTQSIDVEYPTSFTTKPVGTVYNSGATNDQPNICVRCCRDHHDSDGGTENSYRWYWPGQGDASVATYFHTAGTYSGDHKHFYSTDGTTYTEASAEPQKRYLENCRFKRVDGIYRLMQDWRMVDITTMPSNFLASGSQGNADYTTYIASVAEAVLETAASNNEKLGDTLPNVAKPTGRDLVSGAMGSVFTGSQTQLLARTIYVDPLTVSEVSTINNIKNQVESSGSGSWLDKVPFYEINATLLANWEPGDATIADVENDPVITITDPDNDYYGSYERGLVLANAAGVTSISASSLVTNTGVIGHRNAADISLATDNIFDTAANELDDSITVEVEVGSVISGTFACFKDTASGGCGNAVNYNTIVVATTAGSCTVADELVNGATWGWQCSVPNGFSGNVSFSAPTYGFIISTSPNGRDDAVLGAQYDYSTSAGTAGIQIYVVIPD
ncbi:type IV pilus modification PilV family protein [Marinobacterium aestuariivivens]|uniref:Prepilin-type N-terminal cleavage/methylation domain-containing protein n=1 Tax=Marinobacterium aestuariivivens TaxID=1698799 RepID=A0ABW2A0L4_9GAMM